jgi:hypothetical protein
MEPEEQNLDMAKAAILMFLLVHIVVYSVHTLMVHGRNSKGTIMCFVIG